VGLIQSDAKFLDEREDIIAYIDTLGAKTGLNEASIRQGYEAFKNSKHQQEISKLATEQGLASEVLQGFVDGIISRMVFDGEELTRLLAPLELGWKVRTQKELALMDKLVPILNKLAQGREISGLAAYEK
jgi:type I restriction enzyme R subunit